MKFRSVASYFFIAILCIVLFYGDYPHAETPVYVRWVDDGDTIVLADGRRIRYIGINAPEVGHADIKPEALGVEAKNFNKRMVFQTYVRLEFDTEKNDQYGRSLAYIFSPADKFINKDILLSGYAHYLYRYPNIKYHSILLKSQRTAMTSNQGIWCNWNETAGRYIGNKNSRRFHLNDCPLAQKISPDNRVYFTKRWDAFWQGYSPAKNCLPGGAK